jgi:hypothetical protein
MTISTVTTREIHEYELVLGSNEVEVQDGRLVHSDIQILEAVFDHEPTEADFENWLLGWKSEGYHLIVKPRRVDPNRKIYDEF